MVPCKQGLKSYSHLPLFTSIAYISTYINIMWLTNAIRNPLHRKRAIRTDIRHLCAFDLLSICLYKHITVLTNTIRNPLHRKRAAVLTCIRCLADQSGLGGEVVEVESVVARDCACVAVGTGSARTRGHAVDGLVEGVGAAWVGYKNKRVSYHWYISN